MFFNFLKFPHERVISLIGYLWRVVSMVKLNMALYGSAQLSRSFTDLFGSSHFTCSEPVELVTSSDRSLDAARISGIAANVTQRFDLGSSARPFGDGHPSASQIRQESDGKGGNRTSANYPLIA